MNKEASRQESEKFVQTR